METANFGYEVVEINSGNLNDYRVLVNLLFIARCSKGWAMVSKNDTIYRLSKGCHFITSENSHIQFLDHSDDFECTLCINDMAFLTEMYPFLNTRIWNAVESSTPDNCKSKRGDMLDIIFNQIVQLPHTQNTHYNRHVALYLMLTYLHLIYNKLYKNIDPNNDINTAIGNSIIDAFYQLCNKYHTEHRDVQFYAKKLHVSTRHLYNITMTAQGESPKAVIDSFVIGTIKKLLLTTSHSIQQIASSLNFPDQSTLRQFFKRNTEITPTEYRNRHTR